ncbi:amidohydrolase family protein [Megalodesulfovibrio gigas]|uniref:Putative amidohydrolase n=1 Tax=Megalodesulfovibrio gigas (strain ATCC 19364 / DSM 1382 / NCIMB 9332 / VKM B-1759) TaxID=1121448 RepID=T2GE06_MEGG1|nr:amidohydrolase family protein [Megalodesulfovibrio gigas]AGW14356.1 putative amidohydrolase [Megalodesulfovibrio gigas DSM 1382 = ATCC 19364]
MATLLRARRALTLQPGRPVIEDAALVVGEDGLIHDVGTWKRLQKSWSFPTVCVQDMGEVDLVPGPLNAHTHLELSHTLGRTRLGQGFGAWLKSLLALDLHDISPAFLRDACHSMTLAGTAFVADVTSRHPRLVAETLARSLLDAHLFWEMIGHAVLDPSPLPPPPQTAGEHLTMSLMGHAPYTTSGPRLQAAKVWNNHRDLPFCLHLAEHDEEREFLRHGTGILAGMVLGTLLPADWTPPGTSSVAYAKALQLLDRRTLAVHCVQLDAEDINTLKTSGATVCLCPRSNAAIAVGRAPVEALRAAGVPLCLGTDGLCSTPSLNVLDELAFLLPQLDPAPGLLEALGWLTTEPARFFGVSHKWGMIAPGRPSRLGILPSSLRDAPL